MKYYQVSFFIFYLMSALSISAQTLTTLAKAEISFSIQNARVTVNGTMGAPSGTIALNPEKIQASSLDLSVQSTSIKTGISMRDSHLKKKEYFDAAAFPTIILKSKFFGKQGYVFKGYFLLTLKGITKDVTIPFTLKEEGDKILVEGNFIINRLDFGLGSKSLVMGNEVKVNLKAYLQP